MTDAELIRKQTEKIFKLEEALQNVIAEKNEIIKENENLILEKSETELRCLEFSRKFRLIEEETDEYQFENVTNLQNKIKSILMSENEKTH